MACSVVRLVDLVGHGLFIALLVAKRIDGYGYIARFSLIIQRTRFGMAFDGHDRAHIHQAQKQHRAPHPAHRAKDRSKQNG